MDSGFVTEGFRLENDDALTNVPLTSSSDNNRSRTSHSFRYDCSNSSYRYSYSCFKQFRFLTPYTTPCITHKYSLCVTAVPR